MVSSERRWDCNVVKTKKPRVNEAFHFFKRNYFMIMRFVVLLSPS